MDQDGDPVKGAGFTLYKWYADQNNWVAVGSEIKLDGVDYKFVKQDDILAVVTD